MRQLLFLVATLAACASGAATSTPRSFSIPEYRRGSYSFMERVPTTRGETVPLDGEFVVTSVSGGVKLHRIGG